MKPQKILKCYRTYSDCCRCNVSLDALRAEQLVVDLNRRRLVDVVDQRDALGLDLVGAGAAADLLGRDLGVDWERLTGPQERRQQPEYQLECDLRIGIAIRAAVTKNVSLTNPVLSARFRKEALGLASRLKGTTQENSVKDSSVSLSSALSFFTIASPYIEPESKFV